ncbi:hypothetical protein [Halalkalicoccus sp. NIPERK01]|uniref:hypothetical protein n=1 Tax=Halalkalicoccus sp. NIPERK01 TaxID=3053469 RepID=UPI00256F6576|nr:hypothetical protein [Halalkalicoccus sp. NIPERK01]MDL5363871.1 hypothetical protein [Halalkalicoccus sp. NIPERK01]
MATKIRSHTHAFEEKLFNIVSIEYFDEVCETDRAEELLGGKNQGYFTAVVGPTDEILAGPLDDKKGIVYAEFDLESTIKQKLMHDVIGQYNRFDIFKFGVNRNRLKPLHERGEREVPGLEATDGRQRESQRDEEPVEAEPNFP